MINSDTIARAIYACVQQTGKEPRSITLNTEVWRALHCEPKLRPGAIHIESAEVTTLWGIRVIESAKGANAFLTTVQGDTIVIYDTPRNL